MTTTSASVLPDVAYLLGAGASALTLPVVSKIGERIAIQKEWLVENRTTLPQGEIPNLAGLHHITAFETYKGIALAELSAIVDSHDSVDTYAKKLYFQGERTELRKLKATLTLFFAVEQYRNGLDRRYESFLASVMNRSAQESWPSITDRISLLTWNYDQQIAIALARFCKVDRLFELQRHYGIRSLSTLGETAKRKFRVLHLNGIAGYNHQRDDYSCLSTLTSSKMTAALWTEWLRLFSLTYMADKFSGGPKMLLEYAWESLDEYSDIPWDDVLGPLSGIKTLVVVGYSFPFFNREVDRKVIRSMPLQKVYIQTHKDSVNDALETFKSIRPDMVGDSVRGSGSTHQFLLPPEL